MSAAEVVLSAIGELAVHVAGRIVGRSVPIEPERAQSIGEYVVLGVVVLVLVILTVAYS